MDCKVNTDLSQLMGRFVNQENRIGQGIGNGSINPQELQQLESGEVKLLGNEFQDAEEGPITPREDKQLNREANGLSREIYDDKHNGWSCPGEPEPNPGGVNHPYPQPNPGGEMGCGCPYPQPRPPIDNGPFPYSPPSIPIDNGGGTSPFSPPSIPIDNGGGTSPFSPPSIPIDNGGGRINGTGLLAPIPGGYEQPG